MKKISMRFSLFIASFLVIFVMPFAVAFAQVDLGSGTPGEEPSTGTQQITAVKLTNPIKAANLLELVKAIFDFVWKLGIPVIALFIIYAGFKFVAARGNPGELEKAKKLIYGVLIGAAIVLGAWVLASAIGSTIQKLQSAVLLDLIKLG